MKTRIHRNYFSIDHLSQNEIRSAAGLDGRTDGPMAGNIPSSERVDTCVSLLFLSVQYKFSLCAVSLHSFAIYQVDHHEHDMHEGMLHTNNGRYTLLYYTYIGITDVSDDGNNR
jgi:hypothetical protein